MPYMHSRPPSRCPGPHTGGDGRGGLALAVRPDCGVLARGPHQRVGIERSRPALLADASPRSCQRGPAVPNVGAALSSFTSNVPTYCTVSAVGLIC